LAFPIPPLHQHLESGNPPAAAIRQSWYRTATSVAATTKVEAFMAATRRRRHQAKLVSHRNICRGRDKSCGADHG